MSPSRTADANYLCSFDLLSALVQHGVRHAVISSGSRCAPLVLGADCIDGLRKWAHPDERSAGFWALGIGKATRIPAVLICTSGTAAANYLPAVIEARMSRTPLIVLTADRPPELRGCGAPQTIDQVNLYSRYPLYFCDLPAPEDNGIAQATWKEEAYKAVRAALGYPRGPVHLNLPFREPLVPTPQRLREIAVPPIEIGLASTASVGNRKTNEWRRALPESCPLPDSGTCSELAAKMRGNPRGLIICGPQNSCDSIGQAVGKLAAVTGYPIVADVASQVRFGADASRSVVSHFDLILRNRRFAHRLAPDIVLRIGGLPTSKTLSEWLNEISVGDHIVVDDQPEIADPHGQATWKIVSPLELLASELVDRLHEEDDRLGDYANRWRTADEYAAELLSTFRETRRECFEGDVVSVVFDHAPPGLVIYLSNSMPIRLADAYAHGRSAGLRILCNRGANGIDGVVSSAVGAATVTDGPVVLVIGDVGFLHDINGLLAARQYELDLKVVLLNNNGGGIFSFLPIAEHVNVLESLVAMSHGCDFADAARFYGIAHRTYSSLPEFTSGYRDCLTRRGPEILEVRCDRRQTLAVSREIYRYFAEADLSGL